MLNWFPKIAREDLAIGVIMLLCTAVSVLWYQSNKSNDYCFLRVQELEQENSKMRQQEAARYAQIEAEARKRQAHIDSIMMAALNPPKKRKNESK